MLMIINEILCVECANSLFVGNHAGDYFPSSDFCYTLNLRHYISYPRHGLEYPAAGGHSQLSCCMYISPQASFPLVAVANLQARSECFQRLMPLVRFISYHK
jgi:hypothetical protein